MVTVVTQMCQAGSETEQETKQSCGSPLTSLFPCSTPSNPALIPAQHAQAPLDFRGPAAPSEAWCHGGIDTVWLILQPEHWCWASQLLAVEAGSEKWNESPSEVRYPFSADLSTQHPLKPGAVQVFADQQIRVRLSEQVSGERFFLLAQSVPALCASVPAFCGSSLL